MKQGSTFVLVVNLNVDISQVNSVIFTLKNHDKTLTKEEWTYEDGKFKIPFTQEETISLEGRTRIEAQINFDNGSVAKSEIKDVYIKETLATRIVDGNQPSEERKEIELEVDGDVIYSSEDYNDLANKPSINDVVLIGNVTLEQLNIASKDYVKEEIAKFDFVKIVTELPETGLPNRTYLLAKTNSTDNDLYDEYMWVNNNWEYVGTKIIEVDLTDYVKNTYYATADRAGLARFVATYGLAVNENNGIVSLQKATTSQIDAKTENFKCITPSLIDYAVKKALSDCKLADDDAWTDEEKASARGLLNVVATEKETTTYMSADFEGIDSSALTEEELANALSNIGVGSITATNTSVSIADGVLSIAKSATARMVDIFTKDTVPEDGTLNVSLKVDYTSTLKTDVYIVQYTEDISTKLVSDSVPCIVSEDGLWGEYNATIPRETGYPLVAVRIKAPRTYRIAMTIDDVFVVYEKATGYLKDESGQTFIPSTVAEKVKVDEDTDIKEYVDGLFKEYVDDIAELVGGDA